MFVAASHRVQQSHPELRFANVTPVHWHNCPRWACYTHFPRQLHRLQMHMLVEELSSPIATLASNRGAICSSTLPHAHDAPRVFVLIHSHKLSGSRPTIPSSHSFHSAYRCLFKSRLVREYAPAEAFGGRGLQADKA